MQNSVHGLVPAFIPSKTDNSDGLDSLFQDTAYSSSNQLKISEIYYDNAAINSR